MTDRLLAHFHRHANPRGLVLAGETRLTQEFKVPRVALAEAIGQLEAQGKIDILAPLPFAVLALKPRPWRSRSSSDVRKEQQISSKSALLHIEVPVSSRAAAATQEDGGPGEGGALLNQVLQALGPEADRDEFRTILAEIPPALIRRALSRVQATKSIRVSRAALFRSLLQKLSQ